MNSSFLLLVILFSFPLMSCKSKATADDRFTAADEQVDYRKVFETSIKDSGNRIHYKLTDHPDKEGSLVLSASFDTKKKKSFQIIELTVFKTSNCKEDTASKDMKLNNKGIGPSGASFDLIFCAGTQQLKLTDFNRLSMSDVPHGIGLIHLAQLIQVEAAKVNE